MLSWKYFFRVTLFVTIVQFLVSSLPLLIMASLSPAIIVTVPISCGLFILGYYLVCRVRKFHQSAKAGEVPQSFWVRLLPFYLPLFYALLITIIGFHNAKESYSDFEATYYCLMLHYFFWNVFCSLLSLFGNASPTLFSGFPIVFCSLLAFLGTIYLWVVSPKVKYQHLGVAFLVLPIFILAGLLTQSHLQLRDQVLGKYSSVDIIHDETDLSPYTPFSVSNQLVVCPDCDLAIAENHPKIDGALALYPIYAAAVQAGYQNVNEESAKELVKGSTSPRAFSALLNDEADMIFMVQPSEEQMAQAKEFNKELKLTPIGSEAFVFFVNRENPVENLTVPQIQEIYMKKITNWKELGGTNKRIIPFQRPNGSGSQSAMLRVMQGQSLAKPIREEYQELMGGIVNRVADYRNFDNAIGYSFRYYLTSMFKNDGIKIIPVNGVFPTIENIQNRAYPFTGEFYIVTAGSENPHIQELIDWFLSSQGQELIEKTGYVPLVSPLIP